MRTRLRATLGIAVSAALAAGALQAVVAAPAAAAAPVSCSGTAKIFDHRWDGSVWYYEHRAPATGDVSWVQGRRIGTGFDGRTAAGPDGLFYFLSRTGDLLRYRYDGTRWTESGTLIGTGWAEAFERQIVRLTVDSRGRLVVRIRDGALWLYDSTLPRWDYNAGIPLDDASWSQTPFAAGDNVYYEADDDGPLYRWRFDQAAQRFTRSANAVGGGFDLQDHMFSPGGDVIYQVDGQTGNLYWFRYDADTGQWANNGVRKLVGNGWYHGESMSASPSTCSTAAPAPVGNVTPEPPEQGRAYQGAAGAREDFAFVRGTPSNGRVHQLRGTTTGVESPIGDTVFASDVSTASNGQLSAAAIDATGQVWISQHPSVLSTWRPFGRGMTKVRLIGQGSTSGAISALATDADGRLWWRTEHWTAGGPDRWTPWRSVLAGTEGFDEAGVMGSDRLFGTSGDRWFARYTWDGTETAGTLPSAAAFDTPAPASGRSNPPTLVARNKANGQAYLLRGTQDGFAGTTWAALPVLPGSLTVADPRIGVDEWLGKLVVAVEGSDGHVYVTSQVATGGNGFYPWQQLGGTASTAPAVSDGSSWGLHVGFRGDDGLFYHFTDYRLPSTPGPLVFAGGGY